MKSVLIRGGRVVDAGGERVADVAVEDGRIAAVVADGSDLAADVVLDLLDGARTERTRLAMVRRRPVPFPPEPLAWIGIQLTRWSLARADRTGRRNAWLRILDRLGLGFDS